MYATLKGHEEVVEMLSLNKADMNAACKMGNTALHLAAHYGVDSVIPLLVGAGAEIAQRDIDSETPLHRAAYQGHVDAVQKLVDLKADITLTNRDGRAPLMCAEVCKDEGRRDDVKAVLV